MEWLIPQPSVAGTKETTPLPSARTQSSFSSSGAHILCSHLKKMDGLKDTNIGTEELANDITAKVVTLTSITALSAIEDLVKEALVLSPRKP